MMNTCETCKHWTEEKLQEHGVQACNNTPMLVEAFDWERRAKEYPRLVLKPEYVGKKAFVTDASDYSATLYTTKDFGCNQWEAKP